ncbi:MAG: hypothetical protein GY750_13720 [Lentisphaerae bacterium]|nr:hypothetical protein [Lentisphaerota bacterium]
MNFIELLYFLIFACTHVNYNKYLDKQLSAWYIAVMYIDIVSNRKSPPAILLRESYREDGKVRKRTVANITHWPDERIRVTRRLLKGDFDQGIQFAERPVSGPLAAQAKAKVGEAQGAIDAARQTLVAQDPQKLIADAKGKLGDVLNGNVAVSALITGALVSAEGLPVVGTLAGVIKSVSFCIWQSCAQVQKRKKYECRL